MKLYTDLDIVNGLSTCRDMFEAKAYLKANNIAISDQELEILQSQCNKINSERTLTIRQLNNVAGGMKPAFKAKSDPGSPKLNRFTMRGRSSSCGDASINPHLMSELKAQADLIGDTVKTLKQEREKMAKERQELEKERQELEKAKQEAEEVKREAKEQGITTAEILNNSEYARKLFASDIVTGLCAEIDNQGEIIRQQHQKIEDTSRELFKARGQVQSYKAYVGVLRGRSMNSTGSSHRGATPTPVKIFGGQEPTPLTVDYGSTSTSAKTMDSFYCNPNAPVVRVRRGSPDTSTEPNCFSPPDPTVEDFFV